MRADAGKKRPVFDRGVLVLTGATLLLMVGGFLFDSARSSYAWRVEVERADRLGAVSPVEECEEADGLLEGEVIDLNKAGASDLERLPGVGATKAQAIVEYREKYDAFDSVEDLLRVDGIGPEGLERMRPYVAVG